MLVCHSCFGESAALQARFEKQGKDGDCPTCGCHNTKIIEAAELADLFEGLYEHYEPLDGDPYRRRKDGITGLGPDAGDDSLAEILRNEWGVFSDAIDDDTAEAILSEIWPGYTGEYTRRGDRGWREVAEEWDRLKSSLMHDWRFFHSGRPVDEVVRQVLDPWSGFLDSPLRRREWNRARIQPRRNQVFTPQQMGAPPAEQARGGRANPPGISYLYVASDPATAVAEVRAELGDWVTVARVAIPQEPMRMLDLSQDIRIIDPFEHNDLHQALMVRELLLTFGFELRRPIRPSDSAFDYVATQFIAEYFRQTGFGGIIFPSSLANGVNAVFFDPQGASIDECAEVTIGSRTVEVIDELEFNRRENRRRVGRA